jgi:hypothetical protein
MQYLLSMKYQPCVVTRTHVPTQFTSADSPMACQGASRNESWCQSFTATKILRPPIPRLSSPVTVLFSTRKTRLGRNAEEPLTIKAVSRSDLYPLNMNGFIGSAGQCCSDESVMSVVTKMLTMDAELRRLRGADTSFLRLNIDVE